MGEEGDDAGEAIEFAQNADRAARRGEEPAQEGVDPGASAVELPVAARVGGERGGQAVLREAGGGGLGGEKSGGEREEDAFAGEGLDDARGIAEEPDATGAGAGRCARLMGFMRSQSCSSNWGK